MTWLQAPLGELLLSPPRTGISRTGSPDSEFRGLTLSAVRNGFLDMAASKPIDISPREADHYQVRSGAFYVVRGNGRLSLVGRGGQAPDSIPANLVFPDLLIEVVANSEILDRNYLRIVWQSPAVRSDLERRARTSAGIYKINLHGLLRVVVPVPSIDEQRSIARRLDEQLRVVDGLRARMLARAETAADLIRQCLAAAFMHGTNEGWPEVRLRDVVHIQLGKMLSPASKTGTRPVPYLRNANVHWDRFDLSVVHEMDFSAAEEQKFSLRLGDVLVCEGGEPGRAAIWSGEIERCCYQKALHRLRPIGEAVDPRFLLYRLWLGAMVGEFTDNHAATTIAHLPAIRLAALTVRLPGLEEQRSIAAALREKLATIDAMSRAMDAELAASDRLSTALLQREFGNGT